MNIDFRNANEMDVYPISADVNINEKVLSRYYEAKFNGTPHAEGWYVLTEDNLTVNLTISIEVIFKCDRCLTDTLRKFELKVAEIFVDGDTHKDADYVYHNGVVDLTDIIEERFLLSLPMTVLCKPDCKGLCPKCGTNLNESKCNCDLYDDEEVINNQNNPFAELQNLKINAGGAKNGSTKK